MISSNVNKSIVYALYFNGAILLAILIALIGRGRSGYDIAAAQVAADQPPITGGNGIFVMPCQLHPDVWGCYLVDTNRQTLAVYEYRAGEKALVLSAARDFRFDLDLKNYNTSPAWYLIKKGTEEAAQNEHANESDLPGVNSQPPQHEEHNENNP